MKTNTYIRSNWKIENEREKIWKWVIEDTKNAILVQSHLKFGSVEKQQKKQTAAMNSTELQKLLSVNRLLYKKYGPSFIVWVSLHISWILSWVRRLKNVLCR